MYVNGVPAFCLLLIGLFARHLSRAEYIDIENDKQILKIEEQPIAYVEVQPGEPLNLFCEAFGRPPPTIRWLFNGRPVDIWKPDEEANGILAGNALEKLSNYGVKSLRTSITQSRLSLDCVDKENEGVYTCVAENTDGERTSRQEANTTVKMPDNGNNVKDACNKGGKRFAPFKMGKAPKIHMWTDTRLERPEAAAQLFCRAIGSPRPTITWYLENKDGDWEKVQNGEHFVILPSGDLLTKNPAPSSRGGFTFECRAENAFGSDKAEVQLVEVETDSKEQ